MRHGKKNNHLGRTASHRAALLSNMASSLILHKRVITTVAKAKALRKYVEPLLTKSKSDTTHSRRTVFSYLQNKESVKELYDAVAGKIANRPGGYTRIIKTGNRLGDNADMCIIELVDYNEDLLSTTGAGTAGKAKTRRRASGKKKDGVEAASETPVASAETATPTTEASAPAAEGEEAPKAE
ncbi:50S ribosomal protein L17 [Rufibacter sp. LB8]|uniref:50S ribosomal protein L17 n=1 Tax=Rufibacter sp. LB8 TaxID=2777781 RepID=UPI00178C2F89|nr:50S ribosomal protein L17 [Rufibacter sp. LB8]